MANPKAMNRAQLMARIDSQRILDRMQACALGNEEMTNEELRAALALLARTFPEIKQSQSEVTTFDGDPNAISNDQLAAIVAAHSRDDAPGEKASTH